MRSDFEERRQRRIDRLRQRSEQAGEASEQAREAADGIARHIPLGQPILSGHHSEKRHRRDLKRIDDNAWQRHYSNAAIYYAKVQAGLPTRAGATAAGAGEAPPAPAEGTEKPQEAPQSPPEGPAGPPEGSAAESGAGEAQAACARCDALVPEKNILRADEGSPLCPKCFYLYEQGDIQWPELEQEGAECPSI